MRAKIIAFALTASAVLTACGEAEPLRTVSDGCLVFKPLTYANPAVGQERADDPGNRYDTPETIAAIDEHDAVFDRVCGQ
jgi:hypothetical protein